MLVMVVFFIAFRWILFFFQAEDGIRDKLVTGVQTCALPISLLRPSVRRNGLGRRVQRSPRDRVRSAVGAPRGRRRTPLPGAHGAALPDRKSTRLNSSH